MKIEIFCLILFFSNSFCEFRFHPRKTKEEIETQRNGLDPLGITLDDFSEIWIKRSQDYINDRLNYQNNNGKAKNVIFFLGDGLSLTTTAATRMYLGGEEVELSYERFPHLGFVKTYCVDRQVADSACTANAFLHGVKNNYQSLGLTANVSRTACTFTDEDITYSIAKWAQDAGKATGVVTTTRITHATPAGAYAHSPHRSWENNAAISSTCRNDPNSRVTDIAHQLVYNEEAQKFKVILGCGRREFLNTTERDEENGAGRRTDGRNLINEWLEERNKVGNAQYVWHKQQLDEVDVQSTDYLLGLFENDHCMYRNDIRDRNLLRQEPLLTDMTRIALQMLQKDENGFFLLVEAGRIDHAHHSNRAPQSMDETAEFARAIELARSLTSSEDTLIVVSSDHSHVFTYAGYPVRRNDINHIAGRGSDRRPYETLSYSNGPSATNSFDSDGYRRDISNDIFGTSRRAHQSLVPLSSETHAGEDVAVYADGPWAQLFQGSYEQSVIPLAMAYSAHIGPYADSSPINPGKEEK
ncbi:hypothetical protein PVAND_015707 [Polypedilum vanderplanki]|uniref:alkaline phosphatase n=1 Tax=Polypedilum vanderplanki TaxID=319348 RepID=A0A9J6BCY0_POLVA|nr:hypothetical protein PVAND_015707 [Polypedilum vanderplanki]